MAKNKEFFIHTSQTEKILYLSKVQNLRGAELDKCRMTPDDVDFEMSTGKDPEILEICGMNQPSLEHFVQHYGKTYRYLDFFKCPDIKDFSPLEDLTRLEEVTIYWNTHTDRLWNFGKNESLRTISILDAKRITWKPDLLKTSRVMENVFFSGSAFNNYPMESLECFAGMPALKHLSLRNIRLTDKSMDFLKATNTLQRFDFDPGMLTTEEIAWIVAKYPNLSGKSLCAYNTEDAVLNDVRVCGYRKPGLDLPQHQKRLDKYVAQFNALVEQFRSEL